MRTASSVGGAYFTPTAGSSRSAAYGATVQRLERFARDVTAPVLLHGESGTGKTSLARLIHNASPRAGGPFQHVVLSTLDDGVASSELFGHVAGAFTDARRPRAGYFASANGGTLFLDEIGKASQQLQQKLLHAIEYGEIRPVGSDRAVHVDVRLIAATNLDLAELVEAGRFLPDLNARLATFRVAIPALRDRQADIPALVLESLARHSVAAGYSRPPVLDSDLLAAIQRAPWPNNLRQLDATIHRLMLEAIPATTLTLSDCVDELAYLREFSPSPAATTTAALRDAVRRKGSVSAAARSLGIDRKTLRLRLARAEGIEGGAAQEKDVR